ncbi:hypothetical protein BH10BAC4_BH10BAC4_12210 [soil metagenome]
MTEPTEHTLREPLTYTEVDGDILPVDGLDSSGWANNGSFDHMLPAGDELLDDTMPNVDIVDEPSKRQKRQQELLKGQNFLATSPGELVRATGLTDPDADLKAGAASYITRIIRRQVGLKSKPDDPVAAGRAVTKEIIDYAIKARGDRGAILHLREILDNTDLLPTTPIIEISTLKDKNYDEPLRRALSDLLRLTESLEFTSSKTPSEDHLGDKYGSMDKVVVDKLQEFVKSLTISEATDLINMSDDQHRAQLEFWIARINEIEKYSTKAVKGIAKVALSNLGVQRTE